MKRDYLALEGKEWDYAIRFFNCALDEDAEYF